MSAKRPPAVQRKAYIEIDLDWLQETGEIRTIGEPIIAPTITKRVPKGKFEIVYTSELFGILDKLGNKKIQVLSYLLEQKDGNNQINMTNTEIAKEIKVARKTVVETIKILEGAELLRRKGTVIMLSANFMVKGNQLREAYLMQKFEEMSPKAYEAYENAIDVEVDPQISMDGQGQLYQKSKEVKK